MRNRQLIQLVGTTLSTLCLFAAPIVSHSTEQGEQRREGRDVKQDTRSEARSEKIDCRQENNKSNAACRQDKRETKQEGREKAPDIKY